MYINTTSVNFICAACFSERWGQPSRGTSASKTSPFLLSWRKERSCYYDKETITSVITFMSTCWILCTAELVSVSSPTITVLNSAIVSCLGSVKSTYSSDSDSSGSAWTLSFFLDCLEGRLGRSWAILSFSRVSVGWRGTWNISWQHKDSDRSSNLDFIHLFPSETFSVSPQCMYDHMQRES